MIKIIDTLRLNENGLVVKGTNQLVHLQQGSMDGACAVYSLMMCLIICKAIKRTDVTSLATKHDKRTSKGRLVNNFLNTKGMVLNGYYIDQLKEELNHVFLKEIQAEYHNLEERESIIKYITDALDNNNAVEIGFVRSSGGHAVVAIGYEKIANHIQLFCLDPGFSISEDQYWNNIIEFDNTSTAKYNCINYKEKKRVQIDEVMIVRKRQ